jgi:DoxX-like family
MNNLGLIATQLVVSLGLLNVWLIRYKSETAYRGGDAKTLQDEFKVYGLNTWVYYAVGFLKITASMILLLGIWIPNLILPASTLILLLMIGAVFMHFKVQDPIRKALPAISMLLLNLYLCAVSINS